MLTASMFCVGMPYLFRDAVNWVTADHKRWTCVLSCGARLRRRDPRLRLRLLARLLISFSNQNGVLPPWVRGRRF